jgi:glycosyltransferase involved in cell wall biosynthesis
MVGDGPLKVKMQEKANLLGIQDRITYTGYQSDVRPWIAMSDLLLLTSDTEGMPGVVLEAAAMKTPSISGNVGGVAEFIEDGLNGFIVDWNSTINHINLIVGLTKEKQVLKNIGDIARQNVRKRFSIQIIFTEYYKFFIRCLLSKSND